MASPGRSRWYKAAKWFALAFVVALVFVYLNSMYFSAPAGSTPSGDGEIQSLEVVDSSGLLLGLAALCLTGIGTISSVILGWRSERRQAAESRLRIAQLELQVAQARAEAEKSK